MMKGFHCYFPKFSCTQVIYTFYLSEYVQFQQTLYNNFAVQKQPIREDTFSSSHIFTNIFAISINSSKKIKIFNCVTMLKSQILFYLLFFYQNFSIIFFANIFHHYYQFIKEN
jgi:hypothetical protein